jgi:polyisoprenoid-binding protein YceI
MRVRLFGFIAAAIVASTVASTSVRADDYKIDAVHSGVTFKIMHASVGYVYGRFNEFSGEFAVDSSDAAKCSFAMNIKTGSVDTNNKGRDDHLRSPALFNASQFPTMTFKSTSVKAISDGFEVTGDFTMHDVTKPVTFELHGGKTAEFPKGHPRTGFWTDFVLKRSDFNLGTGMPAGALGDDVHVSISFEGTKK